MNCHVWCIDQTGRRVVTEIRKHELSMENHRPLTYMFFHEDQEEAKPNLNKVQIPDQATTRHAPSRGCPGTPLSPLNCITAKPVLCCWDCLFILLHSYAYVCHFALLGSSFCWLTVPDPHRTISKHRYDPKNKRINLPHKFDSHLCQEREFTTAKLFLRPHVVAMVYCHS